MVHFFQELFILLVSSIVFFRITRSVIFENNWLTVGKQYNAVQNFYNLLLTEFHHMIRAVCISLMLAAERYVFCLVIFLHPEGNFQPIVVYPIRSSDYPSGSK